MKSNLTDVTILLDCSDSMSSCIESAESAMNEFVANQKKLPGQTNFTFATFSEDYTTPIQGVPIESVGKLKLETRGMTALIGAIGKTIDDIGQRLAKTPEDERPEGVLVVVITDGQENATPHQTWSRIYSKAKVREMIKHQEEKYKWRFVFLAANQDAFLTGNDYGFSRDQTLAFSNTTRGMKSVATALNKVAETYTCASFAEKGSISLVAPEDRDIRDDDDKKIVQSIGPVQLDHTKTTRRRKTPTA